MEEWKDLLLGGTQRRTEEVAGTSKRRTMVAADSGRDGLQYPSQAAARAVASGIGRQVLSGAGLLAERLAGPGQDGDCEEHRHRRAPSATTTRGYKSESRRERQSSTQTFLGLMIGASANRAMKASSTSHRAKSSLAHSPARQSRREKRANSHVTSSLSVKRDILARASNHAKYSARLNVVFVGRKSVGKSSLIRAITGERLGKVDHQLRKSETPITRALFCSDVTVTDVFVRQDRCQVHLWEVFSQRLAPSHLRSAHVIALCFDVTDRSSFEDVLRWYQIIQDLGLMGPSVYLIAHKVDLVRRREIPLDETRLVAQELGLKLFETSAAFGGSALLDRVLHEMVDQALADQNLTRSDWLFDTQAIVLSEREGNSDSLVCHEATSGGCFASCELLLPKREYTEKSAQDLLAAASRSSPTIAALGALQFASRRAEWRQELASQRVPCSGEVYCPQGCGKILIDRPVTVQQHLESQCKYRRVSCPLECGVKLQYCDVANHAKVDCPNRVVYCDVCQELVPTVAQISHKSRWSKKHVALWNQQDVAHWLEEMVGQKQARVFVHLDISFVGRNLMVPEQRAKLAIAIGTSLSSIESALPALRIGHDATKSTNSMSDGLVPLKALGRSDRFEQCHADESNAKDLGQCLRHPQSSENTKRAAGATALDQQEVRNFGANGQGNSLVPRSENNAMLAGIAAFDKSKLRDNGTSEEPARAAESTNPLLDGIAGFDQSKLRVTGGTHHRKVVAPTDTSRPAQESNPMLAAISCFDRNKLRNRLSENEDLSSPGKEEQNFKENPLIAGIKAFSKDRLRRTREMRADKGPAPSSSGNPLFASLSAALDKRRQVIDKQDVSDDEEDDAFAV